MPWHYRIIKRIDKIIDEPLYGIHEYFYDLEGCPDLAGKNGWSQNPVAVVAETPEDIRRILEQMLQALDRPIIEDVGEEESTS